MAKHRVFISYHHADQAEVNSFIQTFDQERDVFTYRAVGAMTDDIIDSTNPEYVMSQIRQKYLADSTVTIVLIGKCTWARRYVDWEIKTSLRQGSYTPNGLVGILLPSAPASVSFPPRLAANIQGTYGTSGYARFYNYPMRKDSLATWIEDAFQARQARSYLIQNSQDMFKYNRTCE